MAKKTKWDHDFNSFKANENTLKAFKIPLKTFRYL